MGESKKDALRVNFDSKLKPEFHGVKVTSDAGLLAYREIDDAFRSTEMAAYKLTDNRTTGRNTQHSHMAWNFLDHKAVNFVKLSIVRRKLCFANV